MLKFFRKIRQKLLDENKTSRYLKYAIGEIMLVVFGILIALQINNWNQDRLNHHVQIKYLSNIVTDLHRDTLMMQRLVLGRYDRKIEGLQLAKAYAQGTYKVIDTLDFLSKVSYGAVFANGIEFLNVNTYDELKSTGNLQLVENDSLKKSIQRYYNFIDQQKKNVRFYLSDYITMINSLRVFDEENPNNIERPDQLVMMAKLRLDECLQKANLEITYAKRVKTLVEVMHERAAELMGFIQKELEK